MKLDSGISDICLWNNNYIFASLNGDQSQFILINSQTHKIEKTFEVDEEDASGCRIKVIRAKSLGNYLISSSIKGKLDLYTIDEDL